MREPQPPSGSRFFARLLACWVECPRCGRVLLVRRRRPVGPLPGRVPARLETQDSWDPTTSTLVCPDCRLHLRLGILAWPVAQERGAGSGPATLALDQVPDPFQLAEIRAASGGRWLHAARPRWRRKETDTNWTAACTCQAGEGGGRVANAACLIHGTGGGPAEPLPPGKEIPPPPTRLPEPPAPDPPALPAPPVLPEPPAVLLSRAARIRVALAAYVEATPEPSRSESSEITWVYKALMQARAEDQAAGRPRRVDLPTRARVAKWIIQARERKTWGPQGRTRVDAPGAGGPSAAEVEHRGRAWPSAKQADTPWGNQTKDWQEEEGEGD